MRKFALFLALAPFVVQAQELPVYEQYSFRAEYLEWRPSLTGLVAKGSSAAAPGTMIDLIDDLAIADDRAFEVRATLQFKPGTKLRGSYTPIDYGGEVVADRTLRFGDVAFFRNTPVFTTIKGGIYSADFELDLAKSSWGFFGVKVGARYLDADVVLVAPDRGERETEEFRLPIPTLGVALRLYTGRVSISGDLAGITLGSRGHMYEGDAAVRIHFSDRLAATGGYRIVKFKGEDEPDFVQFRMGGFTFGGEVTF